MTNDADAAGNGFFSKRALSSYMRIVSSGASTLASTVRSVGVSVASSIADHLEDVVRNQVHWAGFDKLECEGNVLRQVLLLGYRTGFEVWDVEEGDDVRLLASGHDGLVSFPQMQKNIIALKNSDDKFLDARPLLVVASDESFSGSCNNENGVGGGFPSNGSVSSGQELRNENLLPTSIRFYSLRMHEYVHVLKFRSAVYSIRCSPQIVAVSQAAQIHCFDAATLEREYTILTCPIVSGSLASGGIGYGPLAVGPRWLAYSGSPVSVSSTGRVSPQDLAHYTGSLGSLPNGSLVAHYAKESSKQLAAGIVTLGDMGYKKLSKYYSELLPDNNSSSRQGTASMKANGTINGHLPDIETIGMYCFQVITDAKMQLDNGNTMGGEVEIERIPTRIVEVRPKYLVPAFDYLQMPRFQQSSVNTFNSNRSGPLLHYKSGSTEDGSHSRRSGCSSTDCWPGSAAVAELPNGIAAKSCGGSQDSVESNEDFLKNVNNSRNNPRLKNQQFVNIREGLKTKAQLEFGNNRAPEDGIHF